MSYIPHTQSDIKSMLDTIGIDSVDNLFDEIPESIRKISHLDMPKGMNECQISKHFKKLCAKNIPQTNFIGAGAYQHHTPAAVIDLITRGEFYTAYTPYQAEASQGSLTMIYLFQSMMCTLTGMDVGNASMYDAPTALAEAILMAVRANKKAKSNKVLVADIIPPNYLEVIKTETELRDIEIISIEHKDNCSDLSLLDKYKNDNFVAVIIPQLNFYGQITKYDELTNWAHEHKAYAIALVNPIALGLLKTPNSWGTSGVEIVCGEGQSLGLPLSAGGPYLGFITAKQTLLRQIPGRIVGKTTDSEGKGGYCLTLQAREQHIRRSKATSNICSNQGLMMTAATIYMSLVGPEGLKEVALKSHQNTRKLAKALARISGVKIKNKDNFMHEVVIELPVKAKAILAYGTKHNIQLGFDLGLVSSDMANLLLVCSTEVHLEEDLENYIKIIQKAISQLSSINSNSAELAVN